MERKNLKFHFYDCHKHALNFKCIYKIYPSIWQKNKRERERERLKSDGKEREKK